MAEVLMFGLRDNPDIIKLFDLFDAPDYESERQEFTSILNYCESLTNQYNALITQMNAMNEKIKSLTDKKNPFTVMVEHVTNVVAGFGEKLKAIKDSIVGFAKNTLEAVRDKGISAVGAVSGALHIHEGLDVICRGLDKAAAKAENLEMFHRDRVEKKLFIELEIPSDLSSLSQSELKAVYEKLLDMGMNADLSSCENVIVKDLVEKIENMLPERVEKEHSREVEVETEQSEELGD